MKTYLVHGPSGSGKDTQLDLLEQKMDFERIATGEMFRTLKAEGHEEFKELFDLIESGGLPNTKQTYDLLREYIKRFDPNKNWIFVGAVRRLNQTAAFEDLLKELGRELDAFIHFKLSNDAAVERLSLRWTCPKCETTFHEKFKPEKVKGKCDNDGETLYKREDDHPGAVRRRLDWYNEDIQPILDYYAEEGKLIEVDASGTIEEIQKEFLTVLGL